MTQTDNSRLEEKLALRRNVLDRFQADRAGADLSVFDCCQATKVMWSVLEREYPCRYWGVDLKPKPGRLKVDSARVLVQGGWDFDVIDVDTYGSPWKHWVALLPHVRKPTVVFLTLGLVRAGGGGGVGREIEDVLGLRFRSLRVPTSIASQLLPLGIDAMLALPARYGLRVTDCCEVDGGPRMHYFGLRLTPAQCYTRQ